MDREVDFTFILLPVILTILSCNISTLCRYFNMDVFIKPKVILCWKEKLRNVSKFDKTCKYTKYLLLF